MLFKPKILVAVRRTNVSYTWAVFMRQDVKVILEGKVARLCKAGQVRFCRALIVLFQ
jgi:hypothetical protein